MPYHQDRNPLELALVAHDEIDSVVLPQNFTVEFDDVTQELGQQKFWKVTTTVVCIAAPTLPFSPPDEMRQ